jgi:Rieske 2Fe-2S family protein
MPSLTIMPSIAALAASHRHGYCLEGDFYLREDVFEKDLELLLGRWICAGHVSDVADPGDWLTVELGAESAIVVRGDDGVLRALANVCRHRGSRICEGGRGTAAVLTCPYHAWTYHLDGRLRRAREMPEGFDPGQHGLLPLRLEEIGGLIFISFGDEPPRLDEARQALEPMTGLFGWQTAKVAERRSYGVAANWKLVMENYHECYHCAPAHPEFSVLHALARPDGRRIRPVSDQDTGLADYEAWNASPDDLEVARVMRSALARNCVSGSRDGRPVAPDMRTRQEAGDYCVFAELGFLAAFLAYPDYGTIYRFTPKEPFFTEVEVLWLVRSDAAEGEDYDPEALAWLWDVTSIADKTIIERNQRGVRSRAYRPGPFSLMEPGATAYVERYVGELARLVGGD